MKVVVTSEGRDLDALASPRFAYCPNFLLVDLDTMDYEVLANPLQTETSGAGARAAEFVVDHGAQAVLTGDIGPHAAEILRGANVMVYVHDEVTVREAIKDFRARQHLLATSPVGEPAAKPEPSAPSREEEIAALKGRVADLQKQLAQVMERLEALEQQS